MTPPDSAALPPDPGTWADWLKPGSLAIYLFHGVVERTDHRVRNYNRKHLAAAEFRAVIEGLKARGPALGMDEVIDHHRTGRPFPDHAFAVTFDDGFANNLTVAAPILRDLDVPATVYVTTDFIDHNRMSWIDRIEWAFETMCDAGRTVSIELPWDATPRRATDPAEMRNLLDDIRANVKSGGRIDGDALATDIQGQLDLPETWSTDDPLDRKLTWDQTRDLATDPLFTLGGHTHSHAVLSFLDDDALADELDTSLAMLRDRAGIGPTHYAYPEGLAHCYSAGVIDALKARGVVCCPSAIAGINDAATDLFDLRRILVM